MSNEVPKEQSLNQLKLADFLVKPIKRLALYPLLMKAIIAHSPKNDKSEKLSIQFEKFNSSARQNRRSNGNGQ